MTGQQGGLRRFLSPPTPPREQGQRGEGLDQAQAEAGLATAERCDLCAAPAGPGHGHVADLERSSLACVCRACYLLFTGAGAGGGRYRAVPERYLGDPARPLTAAEWEELQIPVGLAFFLASSRLGRVCAFYPGPAGVTECLLDLDAWARLAGEHPLLAAIEPDVEAVLASRTADGVEVFLVPVDVCYELAGRMRLLWQGFDGGAEARAAIDALLDTVRSRARGLGGAPGDG